MVLSHSSGGIEWNLQAGAGQAVLFVHLRCSTANPLACFSEPPPSPPRPHPEMLVEMLTLRTLVNKWYQRSSSRVRPLCWSFYTLERATTFGGSRTETPHSSSELGASDVGLNLPCNREMDGLLAADPDGNPSAFLSCQSNGAGSTGYWERRVCPDEMVFDFINQRCQQRKHRKQPMLNIARPGQSCRDNEMCIGGSLCTLPIALCLCPGELEEKDGECVLPASATIQIEKVGIGALCSDLAECDHGSTCVMGRCACVAPLVQHEGRCVLRQERKEV
ncbi:EB module, partial [Ancylostoma caninum]